MATTGPLGGAASATWGARRRERRRKEILRAAAEVLAERGQAGMSLNEVAGRLDLTKATLYHYFESKEALTSACLAAMAEESFLRLSAVAAGGGSATERLRALVIEQQHVAAVDHPGLSRPDERTSRLFQVVISEGVGTGEFEVIDERTVLSCLLSILRSVPHWIGNSGQPPRQAMELVADTVLLMLGVQPRSGSCVEQ